MRVFFLLLPFISIIIILWDEYAGIELETTAGFINRQKEKKRKKKRQISEMIDINKAF